MSSETVVRELDPIPIKTNNGSDDAIRVFELTLDDVTVQLSSWGATITRFLVPSTKNDSSSDSGATKNNIDTPAGMDDLVLGYSSPELYQQSKNPAYLGCIVGRVANRIQHGKLSIPPRENSNDSSSTAKDVISLDINNAPHHLHGGNEGFSHKNWQAQIIPRVPSSSAAVEFTLISPHGDQHYPGSLRVNATYRLERVTTTAINDESSNNISSAVRLSLEMEACFTRATPSSPLIRTPINLAQHSYFNLAGHAHPHGILDHYLHLDGCSGYTPVDETGIPTRQVVNWWDMGGTNPNPNSSRDIMKRITLRRVNLQQALLDYGADKLKISPFDVQTALKNRSFQLDSTKTISPFGFDHNYIVRPPQDEAPGPIIFDDKTTSRIGVSPVATLVHKPTGRTLTVATNAPGVQVYSANFLDEKTVSSPKDQATYKAWQGLCLETQHFPDSIDVDPTQHKDFARGRCVILDSQKNPYYRHYVEYTLQYRKDDSPLSKTRPSSTEAQPGTTKSPASNASKTLPLKSPKTLKVKPKVLPLAPRPPAVADMQRLTVAEMHRPLLTEFQIASGLLPRPDQAFLKKTAKSTPPIMTHVTIAPKKPPPALFTQPDIQKVTDSLSPRSPKDSIRTQKVSSPSQNDNKNEARHHADRARNEELEKSRVLSQQRAAAKESFQSQPMASQLAMRSPPSLPVSKQVKPPKMHQGGPTAKAQNPSTKATSVSKQVKPPKMHQGSPTAKAQNPSGSQQRLLQGKALNNAGRGPLSRPADTVRDPKGKQAATTSTAQHAARAPPQSAPAPQPQKRRVVISKDIIKASIPPNAGGTFQLYGRRVNLDSLIDTGNTSMYALLRAWVQDDPFRRTPDPRSFLYQTDEDWEDSGAGDLPIVQIQERQDIEEDSKPPSMKDEVDTSEESFDSVLDQFKVRGKKKRQDTRKRLREEDAVALDRLRKRGVFLQT